MGAIILEKMVQIRILKRVLICTSPLEELSNPRGVSVAAAYRGELAALGFVDQPNVLIRRAR
jgi:hypothetical protein